MEGCGSGKGGVAALLVREKLQVPKSFSVCVLEEQRCEKEGSGRKIPRIFFEQFAEKTDYQLSGYSTAQPELQERLFPPFGKS